jgi:predicted hydrolase (HD superfamily)
MDLNRLKHSYSVGKKMVEIGKQINLSEEQLEELFLLGFNHDIGYEFTTNGVNHNKIGGEILKNNGYKYWKEVYYHGEVTFEYESLYLRILNQADMQIDKYGNDVGYNKRLDDIESRYGSESDVFKKCLELVKSIKI